MSWRVVYGETRPAWEKTFPTRREASAFAKRQKKFGDVIFSIGKVVPGEPPQSIMAAIEASAAFTTALRSSQQRGRGRAVTVGGVS